MVKVLLITHNSFHKSRNNGKTLESLFSKFPKDNLAQLFFSQNEEPDWAYCHNYYQLTDIDVLKHWVGIYKDGHIHDNKIICANSSLTSKSKIFTFLKQVFLNKPFLRSFLWKLWRVKYLFKWIEDFSPNVIFFLAGNLAFSYDIVDYLSRKYSLPVVVYFTDDYAIYPAYSNCLGKLWKKVIYKKVRNVVANSSLCLSIGELMSEVYEKEFQKRIFPVMNSVHIPNNINKIDNNTVKDIFTISYVGSLHLGREESIVQFSELLSNAMQEIKQTYIFNVYTTSQFSCENRVIFEKNNGHFKGAVYGKDLEKALLEADVLLHIESMDERYYSFAQLSVSTKIPEYLSMAKFVLGYGPSFLASFQLLSNNLIGGVIPCEISKEKQIQMLISYLQNEELRTIYSQNAYLYCKENFDINIVSETMVEYLTKIIKE